MKTRSHGLALTLALLALGAPARAQLAPEAVTTRNTLIDQAYQAALAGERERALGLALRAGRLEWSPSLRAFVAEQQNALGQLAAALGSAQLCAQGAERDAAMPHREQFLSGCRALIASLQDRVAHVVVRPPNPAPPGLRVTVNGVDLDGALLGEPYVITPGALAVAATAPGHEPFAYAAQATARENLEVELVLRARAVLEPRTPVPPARVPAEVALRPLPTSPLRVAGWAAVGTGGALLTLGIVFNLLERRSLATFVDAGCYVPEGGVAMGGARCGGNYEAVRGDTTVSLVGYVGGGAVAIAGVVLLLVTPARAPERARPSVACAPTLGQPGIACGATF